jgi:hypothetical protein
VKVGIRKRLWNWCPKPKKPVSTSLTRLATPMYVSFLIGGLLLTAYAAITFLPSISFLKVDESGWVPREIERTSFPGGDIVVREMRYNPFEKGYISICIEAHISSEENLIAYANSRTNALNALLDTIGGGDSLIEAVITFKNPIKPEELVSLCETSLVKLGEYAIIVTGEKTDTKGAGVLWFPRPQDPGLMQNLTSIKEGYRLEGIIAVECYIKAETARILQFDSRILLIDPMEDPTLLEIKNKFDSKGFDVQVERPFSQEMWEQYAKLKHGVTWVSSAGLESPN